MAEVINTEYRNARQRQRWFQDLAIYTLGGIIGSIGFSLGVYSLSYAGEEVPLPTTPKPIPPTFSQCIIKADTAWFLIPEGEVLGTFHDGQQIRCNYSSLYPEYVAIDGGGYGVVDDVEVTPQ